MDQKLHNDRPRDSSDGVVGDTKAWTNGALRAVAGIATAAGLGVRLRLDSSALWLDETQTIAIASLPTSRIIPALEQDGHPPFFYFLLKAWISVFGTGTTTLRLFVGLIGLAALAAMWFVARRTAGTTLAAITVALGATSPFLVRYSTEVRMYSLVTLLVCLWWLACQRAVEKSNPARLLQVSVVVAAMAFTHYWTLFVLIAWTVSLAWTKTVATKQPVQRVFFANVVGGLVFVLWLPSLLTQLRHTGTPWSDAPALGSVFLTGFADFAGGRERGSALALLCLLLLLGLVGYAGQSTGPGVVEIDLAGRPAMRGIGWIALGPMAISTFVLAATNTAFAGRYLAIVIGFVLVLVAKGIQELGPVGAPVGLGVVAVLSLVGANHAVTDVRSQGQEVASALQVAATADDLVVMCPDQLGPTVSHYLDDDWTVVSYPFLKDATRVDWTDYEDRHQQSDPLAVADQVATLASPGTQIWLVWQDGYRTLDNQCAELRDALASKASSIDHLVVPTEDVFEPMWLTRFNR